MKKLKREFFARNTLLVAQELLGKEIIFYNHRFLITETEAYKGQDDLACHAARGKTPRNAVMFGPPGYSYVYFIYGMYFCLNFVTEKEGYPAAVLIRGAQALNVDNKMLNGPGKLCRYFGITKEHSAVDIIENKNFYVRDVNIALTHDATPRIGISMDTEKLWRFVARKVQERKMLA